MTTLSASLSAAAGIVRIDPGFVLPRSAFLRPVQSERDELLNKLVELRVLLPGAEEMEVSELRDYVQWQTERREVDIKRALWRPANRPKKYTRSQVSEALRDYFHNHIIPKREGRKPFYQGVSIDAP